MALNQDSPAQPSKDKMLLWLKADAGVTANSQKRLSLWADQSGRGNHARQTSATAMPSFVNNAMNANPVVRFNGNKFLQGSVGRFGAPVTIFYALKYDDLHDDQHIASYAFSLGNMATGGWKEGNHISLTRDANINRYFSIWGHHDPRNGHKGHLHMRYKEILFSEKINIITQRFRAHKDSANHVVWINGKKWDPSTYATPVFDNKGDYAIGRWMHPSYPWWFFGDMAEILIYNKELSDSGRIKIENYLTYKYDVSDSKP